MKLLAACAALCLLSACSAGDEEPQQKTASSDPVAERAKSLEKAADASVKIIEKDAQEQIDAAKAENQAAKATPEE